MDLIINNKIKTEEVFVVGTEGMEPRKMRLADAIKLAESTGEDVILIDNKRDVPVVKICRYDKFVYEKQRKEREMRKKQKNSIQQIKEIQINDGTAQHDLMVKAKTIDRMLKEGDKVRIVIKYKGRMIKYIENGKDKIDTLLQLITEKYEIDKPSTIEGIKVSVLIKPCKSKQ